jgi:hypothetical protein
VTDPAKLAREIVASLDVWVDENRRLKKFPSGGLEGRNYLENLITAALVSYGEERAREAKTMALEEAIKMADHHASLMSKGTGSWCTATSISTYIRALIPPAKEQR